MSITTRTDKEVAQLTGDEQAELVLKINALAYRINFRSLADATVKQEPHQLTVVVLEYFQNRATICQTIRLSGPGVTSLFKARLRECAKDLQAILDKGERPFGGAA